MNLLLPSHFSHQGISLHQCQRQLLALAETKGSKRVGNQEPRWGSANSEMRLLTRITYSGTEHPQGQRRPIFKVTSRIPQKQIWVYLNSGSAASQ